MTDYSGSPVCDAAVMRPALTVLINKLNSLTTDMADILHDYNFHQVLAASIVISSVNISLNGQMQTYKTAPIDFQTLISQWMVSPECAKGTVLKTTQWGVHTCLNPMLAWQFLTNDQMLCHKCLPYTTFTDTFIAGMISWSGNKCSQICTASFGWTRAHPVTRKGEAHETLSCYSKEMVYLLSWYLMVQKNNIWAISKVSSARQTTRQDRPSPIPCSSKPVRVASAN